MDIAIYETGTGGDSMLKGRDLSMYYSFENMPYLAMFGGNPEQSTPVKRLKGAQASDWWGNNLLMPNDAGIQLNSQTERALHNVALTSSGRLQIEQAIKEDLAFMKPFAEVSISTEIVATDQLKIEIGIKQPGNLEDKKYIYLWNAGLGLVSGLVYVTKNGDFEPMDFNDDFY